MKLSSLCSTLIQNYHKCLECIVSECDKMARSSSFLRYQVRTYITCTKEMLSSILVSSRLIWMMQWGCKFWQNNDGCTIFYIVTHLTTQSSSWLQSESSPSSITSSGSHFPAQKVTSLVEKLSGWRSTKVSIMVAFFVSETELAAQVPKKRRESRFRLVAARMMQHPRAVPLHAPSQRQRRSLERSRGATRHAQHDRFL